VRIRRTLARGRVARSAKLLTAAVGLVAAGALALPTAAAASSQDHGASQLSTVSDAVQRSGVEGIAWHVDAASNRVVVTADSTVSGAEVATIRRSAGENAGAIRIERAPGVFTPLLSAGDAIYGGNYRCSLGFNVVSGSTYYFLTAGHCGKVASTWYTNAGHTTLIGPTIGYSFPKNDYALVRYDNASLSHPGGFSAANAYVGESVKRTGSTSGTHSGTVTALNVTVRYDNASLSHPGGFSAANAYVGESVKRTGSTSGTHSGTVTALNVTVRYVGGGIVRGMIQTNVCAEPGDSGGPLYDGTKALGLTSGGSGDCTSGGTTFYQPVVEAANAYNVNVY
jgi:streptogrisin B